MSYTRIGSYGSSVIRPRHVARSLGSIREGGHPDLARYRRQLRGFGDDAPAPTPDPAGEGEMPEAAWRAALLAKQTEVAEWQKRWVVNDERQRWIQIAATLSIPLAAAIWRAILGRRRSAVQGVGD
jgi:hypothetical protein